MCGSALPLPLEKTEDDSGTIRREDTEGTSVPRGGGEATLIQQQAADLASDLERRQAEFDQELKIACAESIQKPGRDLRFVGESGHCGFSETREIAQTPHDM